MKLQDWIIYVLICIVFVPLIWMYYSQISIQQAISFPPKTGVGKYKTIKYNHNVCFGKCHRKGDF